MAHLEATDSQERPDFGQVLAFALGNGLYFGPAISTLPEVVRTRIEQLLRVGYALRPEQQPGSGISCELREARYRRSGIVEQIHYQQEHDFVIPRGEIEKYEYCEAYSVITIRGRAGNGTPHSVNLLETLFEEFQARGDADESGTRATYEEMVLSLHQPAAHS